MESVTLEARKRIEAIMDFIEGYARENKVPPSQATIGDHFDKTQAWAAQELRRMERLGLILRNGRLGLEIVGRPFDSIPVNISVLLPSTEDPADGLTVLVDKRVLLGLDMANFKYWVYTVYEEVEPDLIEAGIRTRDLLILRKTIAGDPGDVVLYTRGGTLTLAVVPDEDWGGNILGKVVSIIREEKG